MGSRRLSPGKLEFYSDCRQKSIYRIHWRPGTRLKPVLEKPAKAVFWKLHHAKLGHLIRL